MPLLYRSTVVAVLSSILTAIPAAVAAEDIDLEDEVYGGFYSSEFHASEDLAALTTVAAVGRVTFGGTFHHIHENDTAGDTWSNTRELLDSVWRAEATPFANVVVNGASAQAIAEGAYDAKIEEWATHIERYLDIADGLPRRRVIIAPLQEANGTWVSHGCDPANYRLAFRRFVDIFRERGIDETSVRWAFAPNGWTSPGCGRIADYYPGDSYVDVLAFSAYTFGECFPGTSWTSVPWALDPAIDELTTINATKPIILAQTAAPKACATGDTGGDQAQWVRDLFGHLHTRDNVVGFIWFNFKKVEAAAGAEVMMDWRIWDQVSVSPGWRDGIQGAVHRWPLSDWFRPGPLTINLDHGTPPCTSASCDSVGYVDSVGQWWLSDGVWKEAVTKSFFFGNPGDVAFMGDWDGDGMATPGLYRQSDGYVYLRNSNTAGVADIAFYLGNAGDVPLVGDFDGDGDDTVSIYRPSQSMVYPINELGHEVGAPTSLEPFLIGNPGDVPFVGDFNGDGIDSVALHRPSTGTVYLWDGLRDDAREWLLPDGTPGDVVLAGDWDGDGDETVAVYRPSKQRLYVYLEHDANLAAYTLFVGAYPVATSWSRPTMTVAEPPEPDGGPHLHHSTKLVLSHASSRGFTWFRVR